MEYGLLASRLERKSRPLRDMATHRMGHKAKVPEPCCGSRNSVPLTSEEGLQVARDRAWVCVPSLREGRGAFRLFTEGDELYDAMITAIEGANDAVKIESYIFSPDPVGRRFAAVLEAKARAGLDVRLHLDAFGSGFAEFAETRGKLERAGVKFKWFHPFVWRHPLQYFQRNHRKLMVIDSCAAFLGGFNIRQLNSRRLSGVHRQRDTHVQVPGRLASLASLHFDQLWQDATPINPLAIPDTHPGDDALLVPSYSRHCRQRLACLYAGLIERAQRDLVFTSPYFAPGPHIELALQNAARRGVRVSVLLPHKGDPMVGGWATRAAYEPLLAAGVSVFEYLPRKLHAKTCAIDGEWAVIGSANLDHLSLFVNQELILVAHDRNLAESLCLQHDRDLQDSVQVSLAQWRARGWRDRALEMLGGGFRSFL